MSRQYTEPPVTGVAAAVDANMEADASARAQWLSAAMDGELSEQDVQSFRMLCATDTEMVTETETAVLYEWHSYNVIGEALRETNARCAVCDSTDFMAQLRQRLHNEKAHHCSMDWLTGAATNTMVSANAAANDSRFWKRAAGFASVAAVAACGALLWFSQAGTQPVLVAAADSISNAGNASVSMERVHAVPTSGASSADVVAGAGQWEPDARWAEYLRTHRQYAGDPYWSDQRRAGVQRTGFQNGR